MAGPEHKVQVAVIKYLRSVLPRVMVAHVQNEHGKRGKSGMIHAQNAKSAGSLPGFPDLIVMPEGGVSFFLEVKAAKGRVSDTQARVHEMLKARGYRVGVVKSVDDVKAFLADHDIETREVML